MPESELFEKGLQVRREVLAPETSNRSLAEADDFMMAFQRIVTEWAWGDQRGATQVSMTSDPKHLEPRHSHRVGSLDWSWASRQGRVEERGHRGEIQDRSLTQLVDRYALAGRQAFSPLPSIDGRGDPGQHPPARGTGLCDWDHLNRKVGATIPSGGARALRTGAESLCERCRGSSK